jgi:hypothetical protein
MDASFPEILFNLHSHDSCRPSGDCGGSRDRTRDCCVSAWFQLVDLTTELPHPQEGKNDPSNLNIGWGGPSELGQNAE